MKSVYLVATKARPGDIILSAGPNWPFSQNWPSWIIQFCTLSRFTHASVMMTRLGRLETNGPMLTSQLTIGPTVCDLNNQLLINLDCRRAVLMRPTEQCLAGWISRNGGRAEDFEKRIRSTVLAYLGREYSDVESLIEAVPDVYRLISTIVLPIFSIRNKNIDNTTILRRWFCSSLVAQAYEDADMPLSSRKYSKHSPGSIRCAPTLKKIENAVVRLKPDQVDQKCADANPGSEISGQILCTTVDQMIQIALDSIKTVGIKTAVQNLEKALTQLIANPTSELGQLLLRERRLIKRQML